MVPDWAMRLPLGLINSFATDRRLDSRLIAAIVFVESGGHSYKCRYEEKWRYLVNVSQNAKLLNISTNTELIQQKTSWGLMQVMGSVAREYSFRNDLPKLCKPEIGLMYGMDHFQKFLTKYKNIDDAVSSYNQGSPRKNEDGKYKNQKYVDKVNRFYSDLIGV